MVRLAPSDEGVIEEFKRRRRRFLHIFLVVVAVECLLLFQFDLPETGITATAFVVLYYFFLKCYRCPSCNAHLYFRLEDRGGKPLKEDCPSCGRRLWPR